MSVAVRVTNAQRRTRVDVAAMRRLARCAIRRLRIHAPGTLAITFIEDRRMRALNKRFKRHDWVTDVLTFRYDDASVAGEILIAPSQAVAYAHARGLAYRQELSRYVVHGLLHWLGHDDRTADQQRLMRRREDRLLAACAG